MKYCDNCKVYIYEGEIVCPHCLKNMATIVSFDKDSYANRRTLGKTKKCFKSFLSRLIK